ncbi:hypothetical protein QBC40DRAFT_179606 [Triangularia verruculosa]|uniref:DUF7719 domain-containing protein n=1 Tax=Triangularia verruculosa TaxID=2587418 RepID=A0AAN7AT25_9PEZI|nr:hypothetical protein QBC40DRAFT_179606 [Triangularia verruculosa]
MARQRKDPVTKVRLRQPDRSGPKEKTLLEIAQEKNLFAEAQKRQDALNKKARRSETNDDDSSDEEEEEEEASLSPTVERFLETMLWTTCLSMLHFTLDVLVQHQYSADRVVWPKVWMRFFQALLVFGLLVYNLHPHHSKTTLVPGLPLRFQSTVRQSIFFVCSVCAGCYMIYITNTFGYLAVMKQAPSLGCLWVWSVIELELPWAVVSLAVAGGFLWFNGYDIK